MRSGAVTGAGLFVAMMVWLGGCAVNPVSGHSDFVLISEAEEITLGREADPEITARYGGRYDDAALQAYVQQIGAQLAVHSHRSELYYHFTVLDSAQVNAFALPGGYVYITRGLLAYLNSEAQLAAVLGHEIGHVTARHGVRQISAARAASIGYTLGAVFVPELRSQTVQNLFNVLGDALISGYGREHELEADRLGAEYLARSGYDPQAMIGVIGVLKDQEEFEKQRAREEGREPHSYHGVFASHPENDTRLQEVLQRVATLTTTEGVPPARRDTYLDRVDGLVYGSGARQGIVRGGTFYHRDLGIAVDFPAGWQVDNQPDRLVAHPRDGSAFLQLHIEDLNKRLSAEAFLRERLGITDHERGTVLATAHGLDGYTALAELRTAYGPRRGRVAVLFHRQQAYIFFAATRRRGALADIERVVGASLRSLRPLQTAEAGLAEPLHLDVITAPPGASYEALARTAPLKVHAVEILRLLNGAYPKGGIAPGRRIKVLR